MARVPLYGDRRIEEAPNPATPLSGEIPSREAFGGGQSAAAAFGAVEEMVLRAKKEADETAVQDADNKAAEAYQQLLFDDKNGALTKKGKDALDLPNTYGQEYDKRLQDIEKGLNGTAQRNAFKQRAFERKLQFSGALEKHGAAEAEILQKSTFKTGMEIARQDGVTNSNDPLLVKASIKKQHEFLDKLATMDAGIQGSLDLLKQEAETQTHAEIIQSYMSQGMDLKAENYFNANKDNIHGDQKIKIQGWIEETTRMNKAFGSADGIFQKAKGDKKAAYAMTDRIPDAKTRKMVEQRVEYLFERNKEEKLGRDRVRDARFANMIEQAGGDIRVVMKEPEWKDMDTTERQRYMTYADRFGSASTDNLELKDELLNLAADKGGWFSGGSGQKEFLEKNFHDPEFVNNLTPKTREQMIKIQTDLREKKGDIQEYLSTLNTFRGQTTRIMRDAGITDRSAQLRLENDLESVFSERARELGKPLNSVDKLKITKEYLTKVKVNEVLVPQRVERDFGARIVMPAIKTDISKSLGNVMPSDINFNALTVENVPPHLTPSIIKFYKKQGITNPSSEQILNAYKMYLERQSARNLSNDVNQRVR